jgi:hypothetical protein
LHPDRGQTSIPSFPGRAANDAKKNKIEPGALPGKSARGMDPSPRFSGIRSVGQDDPGRSENGDKPSAAAHAFGDPVGRAGRSGKIGPGILCTEPRLSRHSLEETSRSRASVAPRSHRLIGPNHRLGEEKAGQAMLPKKRTTQKCFFREKIFHFS